MIHLERILREKFSFSHFRPGQKEIIQSVLNNQHTLALLPTGTGKSLCYQLPGYVLDGNVLIVSPLLSLMQDQVEQMKIRGEKRVVAINSFLSIEERQYVIKHLHHYKFIFISPEMLHSHTILARLQTLNIKLFVVDEAHCISQWGFDFRPEYLNLGEIRKKLNNPLTLALTATAREDVRNDIVKFLHIPDAKQYIYSVDRKNIAFKVEKIANHRLKKNRLLELVSLLKGPGIIYFSSKKMADEFANLINERKIRLAASYHSGIDQEIRILLQQQFIYNQLDVMCATSAFGMGVNKDNVRYVIHYHPPLNIESYVQEIGRAGRDGKNSIAILLYTEEDFYLQQQLIETELPSEEQIDYFAQLLVENNKRKDDIDFVISKYRLLDGFTETHWRLLWTFYEKSEDIHLFKQNMKTFVNNRWKIKMNQLKEMFEWLRHPYCKREKILSYFQEKLHKPVAHCCDFCGIHLTDYESEHGLRTMKRPANWQDKLAQLLGLEEKSLNDTESSKGID